ncbi:MAG: hypothetical protein D8M58_04590 [Calditrichaeota bacterium]|nr:MAG: hypothetical protein DWQ03_02485 [Calditrichota bacterium]MBL1204649.1 hypothetical protein [Calditrichota bacterium]NOG44477.1 hypothetical protein [Calditrichota bacterium]
MENRTTNIFFLKGYEYRLDEKIDIPTIFTGYDAEIKTDDKIFAQIFKDGQLVVFPDYAWDGMTGWFESTDTIIPSLVHDVLYQFIAEDGSEIPKKKYVKIADKFFMKLLKANKVPFLNRFLIRQGIRFGNARTQFKHEKTPIKYVA